MYVAVDMTEGFNIRQKLYPCWYLYFLTCSSSVIFWKICNFLSHSFIICLESMLCRLPLKKKLKKKLRHHHLLRNTRTLTLVRCVTLQSLLSEFHRKRLKHIFFHKISVKKLIKIVFLHPTVM